MVGALQPFMYPSLFNFDLARDVFDGELVFNMIIECNMII